jgi:sulfur carrier protein
LATALVELGYGAEKVATAVNEAFVPSSARGALELGAGDRVEIVAPQQGG